MGRAPTRSGLEIRHNDGDPTHLRPCVVDFAARHGIPTNARAAGDTRSILPYARKLCANGDFDGNFENHRNYVRSCAANATAIGVIAPVEFVGYAETSFVQI